MDRTVYGGMGKYVPPNALVMEVERWIWSLSVGLISIQRGLHSDLIWASKPVRTSPVCGSMGLTTDHTIRIRSRAQYQLSSSWYESQVIGGEVTSNVLSRIPSVSSVRQFVVKRQADTNPRLRGNAYGFCSVL